MATKLYLHNASSSVAGTLPGASSLEVTAGRSAPTWTATAASTNRTMDTTIGVSETNIVGTNNASVTAQSGWFRRFLSAPLSAQTISIAGDTVAEAAVVESNTNSSFGLLYSLYVWRPGGGGSLVGSLITIPNAFLNGAAGTTKFVVASSGAGSGPTASVTAQAGDVLVLEAWRNLIAQGMATAYTNTFYYDGTTENSSASEASFISLAQTLTFQGAGTTYTKAGHGVEHG